MEDLRYDLRVTSHKKWKIHNTFKQKLTSTLNVTRHVFVKHGCPRRQQSQTMAKISKSYILTPPHPQGHVMSVKCEQPLDELTVQVWLLYDHPNFKYCTLFISGTELRTDGQTDRRTDGRTDDPNTRCPRRTFQAGGIKNLVNPLSTLNVKIFYIKSNIFTLRTSKCKKSTLRVKNYP